MKKTRIPTILALFALLACPALAHHPAADIVDEEIYAMIDAMVADTPHGDMVFDDMGSGMTEVEITGRVTDLQMMIEEGLLSYVALLDGDVTLTIDFTGIRSLSMTIVQDESTVTTDKAADDVETMTLGELKASYR